jgi:GAF domain
MDHSPAPIRTSTPSALAADPATAAAVVAPPANVSAGMAAANAHLTRPTAALRFPSEEPRQSLAEMAILDLDAALQLLADRAQYITGASGAAIALRRAERNDMICRASTGVNAPELGAVLSTEIGLSGESVRTRRPQRCNDAQNDPRVNREGCQRLGIASVVVMPIMSSGQALGVFELFSSKTHAFEERHISALQRLSGMVELALKFAMTAQMLPLIEETPAATSPEEDKSGLSPHPTNKNAIPAVENPTAEPAVESSINSQLSSAMTKTSPLEAGADAFRELQSKNLEAAQDNRLADKPAPEKPWAATSVEPSWPEASPLEKSSSEKAPLTPSKTGLAAPKPPLFWSASTQLQRSPEPSHQSSASGVPPGLRQLQKCQACGFPVSPGRLLCVECEEKRWRGQPLPRKTLSVGTGLRAAKPGAIEPASLSRATSIPAPPAKMPQASMARPAHSEKAAPENSAHFLNSAAESPSWFAANKHVLLALLMVAIVIAVVAILR